MKSKLDEADTKTSCKNCMFAIYDAKTQMGCRADRLSKLKENVVEVYDHEKEFYVITRSCNLYRPPSWNKGVADVDKARLEIYPYFSIMVEIDDMTEKKRQTTLNSLKNINYNKDKIQIILSRLVSDKKNKKLALPMYSALEDVGFKPIFMESIHKLAREMDGFIKAKQSLYVTKIRIGEEISPNMFDKINDIINIDMDRPILIEENNVKLVLFMILNMKYLEHKDYQSFIKEIEKQAKTHNKYICLNEKK